MLPANVPSSVTHRRVPRWRQTLWNAVSRPSAPRTTITLAPATSRVMNAPGCASSGARPTASHIRAKIRSPSDWNHAGSVYARASSVVRARRGEVVLMRES